VNVASLTDLRQHADNSRSLLQRSQTLTNSNKHHQATAVTAATQPSGRKQASIDTRHLKSSPAQDDRQGSSDKHQLGRNRLDSGSNRAGKITAANAAADSRSQLSRPAVSSTDASTRQGRGSLDFGAVPTLDLNSGLENMQTDLSGLVDELRQQGGFWKEGSLQDNISNMVQLGVKGAIGLVSPIVNGLTGGIPITVPSVSGKCLQGKPIRTTSTGLFGSKKRVTKCLVGTGSQVADYLSKAAGSLAGMAGEVLNKPAAPASGVGSNAVASGPTASPAVPGQTPGISTASLSNRGAANVL
jgi:hypothetical protein